MFIEDINLSMKVYFLFCDLKTMRMPERRRNTLSWRLGVCYFENMRNRQQNGLTLLMGDEKG
jgi:hypothetical protein